MIPVSEGFTEESKKQEGGSKKEEWEVERVVPNALRWARVIDFETSRSTLRYSNQRPTLNVQRRTSGFAEGKMNLEPRKPGGVRDIAGETANVGASKPGDD
jgi:hypothetical protein